MATIAAIVGLASTAYTAYSQSQAAGSAADAAGEVPEAARYNPVDFTQEQFNAIQGNFQNLNPINQLMRGANMMLTQNDIARAKKLIPGYKGNMRQMGQNAGSLLGGQLPYDDVLDIVANRSGATNAVGIPGTGTPATLRDLGLSRLDAMKAGGGMFKDMVGIAEQISPISRYSKPSDFFVSPTDRIRMAMEQNQLIQQSDQNANNLAAAGSPAAQAQAASQVANPGGGYADIAKQLSGVIGTFQQPTYAQSPTAPYYQSPLWAHPDGSIPA